MPADDARAARPHPHRPAAHPGRLDGLPPGLPSHRLPLPFGCESTGERTRFTSRLDPQPHSREVFIFHWPDEPEPLVRLDDQLCGRLRAMPGLIDRGMWPAQDETVRNLERSLAGNRPRALARMATGSGKTFTAVSAVYRLVTFAGARRVLFLVDRANLGKQALAAFQQYRSPYMNFTFPEECPVQHLRSNRPDADAKVTITTVQRLYSVLKGDPEFAEENEDGSAFELGSPFKEPLPVVYNPAVPPGYFDVIVIDECHRSIYNVWRQGLEYFDAFLVYPATPTRRPARPPAARETWRGDP